MSNIPQLSVKQEFIREELWMLTYEKMNNMTEDQITAWINILKLSSNDLLKYLENKEINQNIKLSFFELFKCFADLGVVEAIYKTKEREKELEQLED